MAPHQSRVGVGAAPVAAVGGAKDPAPWRGDPHATRRGGVAAPRVHGGGLETGRPEYRRGPDTHTRPHL